jgi:hypothetical protein
VDGDLGFAALDFESDDTAGAGETASKRENSSILTEMGESGLDASAANEYNSYGDGSSNIAMESVESTESSSPAHSQGLGDSPDEGDSFAWLQEQGESGGGAGGTGEISADGSHYLTRATVGGKEIEFNGKEDGKKMAVAIQTLLKKED